MEKIPLSENRHERLIGKHIVVLKYRKNPDNPTTDQLIVLKAKVTEAKGDEIKVIYEENENLIFDHNEDVVTAHDCSRLISGDDLHGEGIVQTEEDDGLITEIVASKTPFGIWIDPSLYES